MDVKVEEVLGVGKPSLACTVRVDLFPESHFDADLQEPEYSNYYWVYHRTLDVIYPTHYCVLPNQRRPNLQGLLHINRLSFVDYFTRAHVVCAQLYNPSTW